MSPIWEMDVNTLVYMEHPLETQNPGNGYVLVIPVMEAPVAMSSALVLAQLAPMEPVNVATRETEEISVNLMAALVGVRTVPVVEAVMVPQESVSVLMAGQDEAVMLQSVQITVTKEAPVK